MWWAGRPNVDIFVGAQCVAVCVDGQLRVHEQVRAGVNPLDAVAHWMDKAPSGGRCTVWLGGALARPSLVPGEGKLRTEAERRQAVAAKAQRHFGAHDPEVWLDLRGPGEVAIVLERQWRAGVESLFRRQRRFRLAAIRPWWTAALAAVLERGTAVSAVGIADAESLVTLCGQGSAFTLVESLVPAPMAGGLAACVQRAALRSETTGDERLLVTLDFGATAKDSGNFAFSPWAWEQRL